MGNLENVSLLSYHMKGKCSKMHTASLIGIEKRVAYVCLRVYIGMCMCMHNPYLECYVQRTKRKSKKQENREWKRRDRVNNILVLWSVAMCAHVYDTVVHWRDPFLWLDFNQFIFSHTHTYTYIHITLTGKYLIGWSTDIKI